MRALRAVSALVEGDLRLRSVAFGSFATDLVPGETNRWEDVFAQ
jgi:hypothetical protein